MTTRNPMRGAPSLATLLAAALAAAALVAAGYVAGTHHATPAPLADNAARSTPGANPAPARKVLYWHDPMVPAQHFDKPGKSPFMDMQLEPVYADDSAGSGVTIDPTLRQNLGIRYATVRRQSVSDGFDAIATTQFDESRADVVQSRVTGYIDHLYASAPSQRIAKGAPIASLFVPDWLAPQEEYLALTRSGMDRTLLDAARTRMRALSIPDSLVAELDRTGHAQTHLTLSSPATGVISELDVRQGAMVTAGQTLAKVSGLSTLWMIVEIPEAMTLNVRPGMMVDATVSGAPDEHFKGTIREVLPGINPSSRTLQARLEIDNSSLRLTPGMLMRAHVQSATPVSRLLVPSEAVIRTGTRTIVIVRNDAGALQPAEMVPGRDIGAQTEVISGLNEGDTVVASGQFLIDSEASLKSVLPRLQNGASKDVGASQAMPASSTGASAPAPTPSPTPASTDASMAASAGMHADMPAGKSTGASQ